MMLRLIVVLSLIAGPALAAEEEPFFSLKSTEFIVTLAFILFVGVLLYMKVPAKIAAMLDARSAQIAAELAEAKALRDEARALLASYEKKQKDVQEQSDRIVAAAKQEAQSVAVQAKADLETSIARRLAAAEDQIASAESKAIRQVREHAVTVAVAAAADVLAGQATSASTAASIDAAIDQVGAKLH